MQAHKLTVLIGEQEVKQCSTATFQREKTSSGEKRLLISVPEDKPGLFQDLTELLPPPFLVLYVLHTPRGEGEWGRYQSPDLDRHELAGFLSRYNEYFAADARHDVWVHSPEDGRTIVWDRHNQIYAEGHTLGDIEAALTSWGFKAGGIKPLGSHAHHYRPEYDDDAAGVLNAFNWHRTPLQPEDEQ